jgi:hypothetical protein
MSEKCRFGIHLTEMNVTIPFDHLRKDGGMLGSVANLLHFKGNKKHGEHEDIVASYNPTPFEEQQGVVKLGEIKMSPGQTQDLILVSALTAQEHAEENKAPVPLSVGQF